MVEPLRDGFLATHVMLTVSAGAIAPATSAALAAEIAAGTLPPTAFPTIVLYHAL